MAQKKQKKTWREKVNEIKEKIHVITPEYEKRYGKGKILIASAVDIEKLILKTEKGKSLDCNSPHILGFCRRLRRVRSTFGRKFSRIISYWDRSFPSTTDFSAWKCWNWGSLG